MKKKKKENKKRELKGVLCVIKPGFGFVDIDEKTGIYISEKNMGDALHKDVVSVEIIHSKKRRECKVLKVLERNTTELIGEYRRIDNQAYLVPNSPKITKKFKIKHVDNSIKEMMADGDIIVGEILNYGDKGKSATVFVNEYLGCGDEKGTDISMVLRRYGIKEKFNDNVLNQPIEEKISKSELSKRVDYTKKTVITIDGEDAKDKDDAISIEKTKNGYVLGVHIADVSYYVRSKTPVDREAYLRGTSVYLPGLVVPMLPKKLSNGVCSLNPDELKLTFSCIMNIDNTGKITDYEIKKTYIKSKGALTYEIVKNIILENYDENTDKYKDLFSDIRLMHELYLKMRNRRRQKGFTDFNFPETKFTLDENGKAVDVYPYETSFSNEIIEEFMLAANTSVADFAMKNNLPFVYRTHKSPDPVKLQNFYSVLDSFGIKHSYSDKMTPKDLNKILEEAKNTPYLNAVMQIALRTMQKAVYSNAPTGHYGLNFKKYCHFTSPIRRYPDLCIHRILTEYLEGNAVKKYNNSVYDISEQSTKTEINAFMAERDCDDMKKAEYMENKVGESFSGNISGMCDVGFFVALENTVEGFVAFEDMKGDYYEFYEDKFMIRGKKRKNVLLMGDEVKVTVKGVNAKEGKVDFIFDSLSRQSRISSL